MKWKKYAIETKASAEEVIIDILNEQGITAIEIEDTLPVEASVEKEGGFFEELQPVIEESDEARIIFYLEEGADDSALLDTIENELERARKFTDIGEGSIQVSVTDEADWRDKWKAYFHPFVIGKLLIRPSWEEPPQNAKYDKEILIDPGISFGTGQHETTRMCIGRLAEYVTDESKVLDIGCGSGILSVTALKLGAASVAGTDIDADCMDSVKSNFAMNGLSTQDLKFYVGDLTEDTSLQAKVCDGSYDIVVANILADIITGMLSKMRLALKDDGVLILSGIINFKEDQVLAALRREKLLLIDTVHLGEWVCITAKKDERA